MSVENIAGRLREAKQTADFQFEWTVVGLTETICRIMEEQRISRTDLAERLGKSKPWVTKMLRGEQNLTLRTIVRLFWALDHKVHINALPSASSGESNSGEHWGYWAQLLRHGAAASSTADWITTWWRRSWFERPEDSCDLSEFNATYAHERPYTASEETSEVNLGIGYARAA